MRIRFCCSTFFCAFSIVRVATLPERVLLALLIDRPEVIEDLVDPLAGEEPDQVVLGGEEEARLAGIAPAP